MLMKKIEEILSEFKNTFQFVLAIIAIITFYFAASNYISNRIDEKITDKTYINNLAKVLRPFSIFDEKGIIKYDHGGERYIKNIAVKQKKNGDFESVIITTKVYLQNPPILTYIGYDNYAYASEKIDTYQWKFNLRSRTLIMADEKQEKIEPIFIVEVTK
jgi:hypothetical protein